MPRHRRADAHPDRTPAGPPAPCDLVLDADGLPWSPRYRDRYHARAGAEAQARHVFLAGNGLPGRWAGRRLFHIVETGFGIGHTFLATWRAWRADPARCGRLSILSIEAHPPTRAQLQQVHRAGDAEADALIAAWPAALPGLHRLAFDDDQVELILAFGDVAEIARERTGDADAYFLDGFAPDRNPAMWDARMLQALTRRSRPDATAATWSAARTVREALSAAGFLVERRPGFADKRDMTVARRRPMPPPATDRRQTGLPGPQNASTDAGEAPLASQSTDLGPAGPRPLAGRRIAVIGAGLAGCATARALVLAGADVHLIERHGAPAAETSGNAAGLVHGVIHAIDTPHAQLLRQAAADARRAIDAAAGRAVARGCTLRHGLGLLRLTEDQSDPVDGSDDAAASVPAADANHLASLDNLRATQRVLGLPSDHVEAVDETRASALAGLPVQRPAWWHADGGWVSPADLCRAWLADIDAGTAACTVEATAPTAPRGRLTRRFGCTVDALQRVPPAEGGGWRVRLAAGGSDPTGRDGGDALAFDAVVVAAAGGVSRRLLAPHADAGDWPIGPARGQLLGLPDATAGLRSPAVAVAGHGYALPPIDGLTWIGATTQWGDDCGEVRPQDALALWRTAATLGVVPPEPLPAADPPSLPARAGVRWRADDRLPLIGPVPAPRRSGTQATRRVERPRDVPRVPGLFVFTALGSRGIAWANWGAQVLVSALTGGGAPVASSLRDRIDPGRFAARASRRSDAANG